MITIALTTLRKQPRFQEFCDSLARMDDYDHAWELLCVDGILWYKGEERREELKRAVNGRFAFKHITPKPSLWQGPTRLTSKDYWDACGARNTVFIAAQPGYVTFIDDCMEVDQNWLYHVIMAEDKNVAYAGTYVSLDNDKKPIVGGEDHRKTQSPKAEYVYGGWLYGMNMGVPLDAALAIDGYDEMYSGQGGVEDCDFGVRLYRYGTKLLWQPESIMYQLMDTHEPVCDYVSNADYKNVVGPKKPKERKLKNGMIRFANEFLTEKLLTEDVDRVLPLLPRNIKKLRAMYWAGEELPIPKYPHFDWRDGQDLSEM